MSVVPDNIVIDDAHRGQDHGGQDAGPVLACAAMEYQRVILPFSDDFESVDQPLAERLLADSIQVDLSHGGRVRLSLRFVLQVSGAIGPERYGVVPGADLLEQERLQILFRVPRTSQGDDGPGADFLVEPGNVALVHLVERRASKHAPPRDGAAVVRPVGAKVSEVGNGFEMDVPWIRLAHTRLHHDARALTIMRSSLSTRIAGEDDGCTARSPRCS